MRKPAFYICKNKGALLCLLKGVITQSLALLRLLKGYYAKFGIIITPFERRYYAKFGVITPFERLLRKVWHYYYAF